jgi:hypothetical protein
VTAQTAQIDDLTREVDFYTAALADATRLQLVTILAELEGTAAELHSGAIVAKLGPDRTWSNTSQHLARLSPSEAG